MSTSAVEVNGLPRPAERPAYAADTAVVRALLWCGVVSMVVYAGIDWLAASRWEGYVIADQAVSELLAVGSPVRTLMLAPMTLYNLLVLAFGVGVWRSAGTRRSLTITGGLLVAYSIASLAGLLLFPLRPDSGTNAAGALPLSGVLHAVITAVLVFLMFGFIGAGSGAAGWRFRLYSLATFAVVLAGGIFAGSQIKVVASGVVVHGLGLLERANIYASLLWVAAFAVVLLRGLRTRAGRAAGSSATRPARTA